MIGSALPSLAQPCLVSTPSAEHLPSRKATYQIDFDGTDIILFKLSIYS